MEYIYILREREFVNLNQPIYKIGRTQDWMKRYRQYPKQTEVLFVMKISDSQRKEKDIIDILKKFTTQRSDIGREYFESDLNTIVDKVYSVCQESISIPLQTLLERENKKILNDNEDLRKENKKIRDENLILRQNNEKLKSENEIYISETKKTVKEFELLREKNTKREVEQKISEIDITHTLNEFFNNDFIDKGSSDKIMRSSFNKIFNSYSQFKFNKVFKSVEINTILRNLGYVEIKTNGDFYIKNLSIDMSKFNVFMLGQEKDNPTQLIN